MIEGVGLASGDRWSPGAAGLRRRLPRADAPARLPAARSAPPGRPARDTRRNGPRELAEAQTVNGREHQGDEPEPTEPRGELSWPVAVMVRGLPLTRRGIVGPSRNPSRAPTASSGSSTLDGTTSRPWFSRLSGEGGGVVSGRARLRRKPNRLAARHNLMSAGTIAERGPQSILLLHREVRAD